MTKNENMSRQKRIFGFPGFMLLEFGAFRIFNGGQLGGI